MSLVMIRQQLEYIGAPRVSGDEPYLPEVDQDITVCSPRERG